MAGFGGAVKLTGESEYRAALKRITQSLRECGSEMKLVSSQYDVSDKSQQALTARAQVLTNTLDAQKSKLATLQAQERAMNKQYTANNTAHNELVKTLETEQEKLSQVEKDSGKASAAYASQKAVVDKLSAAVDKSSSAVNANETAMSRVRAQMNNTQAEINKTTNEIRNLGDAAEKAENGFTVMKGALANLVSSGIQKALGGLKQLSASVFQAGSDFESGMSKVGAISGATGEDLQKLRDKAKEMGASTKFTASESAEAFEYMAMAGWKTGDMLNGISGVMNLAAASGEDLGEVSDIVTDALTAMGYAASDSGHFADVLAAASSNSNTNVGMMGETFKYVAPIAGSMKYSIEDLAVAIGIMANSGIKGEQAGTSLRSVLTRLAAPPEDCASAMEELGISITNSDGSMRSLSDVLGILREKFGGLSAAQQEQYAKDIAGQEAMSGLLALVNASPQDFQKLTDSINNCGGAAENMANTMNDNVSGQITLLKSKVEGIMIKVFDDASGSIRRAIDKISESLDSIDWDKVGEQVGNALSKAVDIFKWIIDHGSQITATISGIVVALVTFKTVAAIGKVVSSFRALATAIKAAETAQIALNLAQMSNPIGLVVGLIAGLVAAIMVLWNTNEGFRDGVTNAWNNVKDGIGNAVQSVKDFFTDMGNKISELPQKFEDWFNGILDKVRQWASDMGQKASDAGSQFVNNVSLFFQNLPYNIGYALGTAIGTVINWASDMGQKASDAGSQFVTNVSNFFQELPGRISNFLTNAANNVANWASDMGQKASSAGSQFVTNVSNFFQELPGRVSNFLSQTISRLTSWASDMGRKGADGARRLFDSVVNGLKSLPDKIKSIGENIAKGLLEGIKNMGNWVKDQVGNFANGVVDGFKNALGIHSPSRVFRDQVGRYIAEGIGVGFADEMGNVSKQMVGAMPSPDAFAQDYDFGGISAAQSASSGYRASGVGTQSDIVSAITEALQNVKVVLDDEVAGRFVTKTVTAAIYR